MRLAFFAEATLRRANSDPNPSAQPADIPPWCAWLLWGRRLKTCCHWPPAYANGRNASWTDWSHAAVWVNDPRHPSRRRHDAVAVEDLGGARYLLKAFASIDRDDALDDFHGRRRRRRNAPSE
jgi:hypothetical protein